MNAQFFNRLDNCIFSSKRSFTIRVKIAVFAIEKAEIFHVIITIFACFLTIFFTAEENEMWLEIDLFKLNERVQECLMSAQEDITVFFSRNHPILNGCGLSFMWLIEDY